MNPADEDAANKEPTERPSAGAVAGSVDKINEQLRVSAEDLLRPSHQPKTGEDLHELLSVIRHRLDHESSRQKSICDHLVAIENQSKRRGSRGFARFLLAICIGVAGTLAWQSYGEAIKQIIATRAPELGCLRRRSKRSQAGSRSLAGPSHRPVPETLLFGRPRWRS